MDAVPRPFSAGSRQAPDPYDQYLEREGFYRKHTARDSTCLFRVVSEQMFDVQLYHEKIRSDCIKFMRKRRDLYEQKVDGDYDEYLDEMSKSRSYGSFVELDALSHIYRQNILLFQPYDCGSWFVKRHAYNDTMMVFFSPDKHFDSIYSTRYIEQAAYCQALVYEILYVRVFKLPDVMYSVERMLHDPEGNTMAIEEYQNSTGEIVEDRIVTKEGRVFKFNTAEETECVLENYRLCHFHNKENFSMIADSYRCRGNNMGTIELRSSKVLNGKAAQAKDLVLLNPMLFDKNISCVRQLLQEGITPFPYKVAKALDSSIYRNIEFDSWSEMRRELKYRNWYYGGNNLQVGVKCMVRLSDNNDQLLLCHIQKMLPNKGPCVVYIEELAECQTVDYEKLQPLPPDQMRPWIIPSKSRKFSTVHHTKIMSDQQGKKKLHSNTINLDYSNTKMLHNVKDYSVCCDFDKSLCFSLDNPTSLREIHPNSLEMVVMPFLVDENSNFSNKTEWFTNENESTKKLENCFSSGCHDASFCIPAYSNQSFNFSLQESVRRDPVASCTFFSPYSVPPSYPIYGPYPTPLFNAIMSPVTNGAGVINFKAMSSFIPNGTDLPLYDLTTLRHFYNLGINCFHQHRDFRMFAPPPQMFDLPYPENNVGNTQTDDRFVIKQLVVNTENQNDILSGRNYSAYDRQNSHENLDVSYTSDNVCSKSRSKDEYTGIYTIPPSSFVKEENYPVISESTSYGAQDFIHMSPYNVPMYCTTSAYALGFPCYGIDSSTADFMTSQAPSWIPTYMIHPQTPVLEPIITSETVGICDNYPSSSDPDTNGPINCSIFPPTIYKLPHTSSAYAVWQYPHQTSRYSFCHNKSSGSNNHCIPVGENVTAYE